jgi:hypothetical protein
MTEMEIRALIRAEVRAAMNVVLNGETAANDGMTEDINALFPGMPVIEKRPIMHPYGFVSRAPAGTISVTVRTGDHVANRMTIGHRDKDRPEVQEGETMVYNLFGDQVYLSEGVITATTPKWVTAADMVFIGSDAADEPFVLGKVFKKWAQDLLDQLQQETHISGLPGYPTTVPQNAAQYAQLKASPIDDDAVLSDKIFGEKG